ncbi:MAG: 4Fe-4S ferredoxin [Acidobacteria bacterium]|nr:4Fe-4S ferredoxin [Acidobacteriota bacterium]
MCQFCHEHGEGKKWYLQMKNYADELLHQELSAKQKEVTRANTRAEWVGRFWECFEKPAVTGVPKTLMEIGMALAPTAELRGPGASEAEVLEGRQITHFGQVIPIEDVEKIIDQADSITRIPCGCRFLTTGKTNARYCFGLGASISGGLKGVPDAASSLEVLDKEEAKRVIREYDQEGLIHSIWTGVTPYLIGICNCDRDCMAYKTYIEQRGAPYFFRAEYVCRVDPDLCNGCKDCIKQCQFGAQFYSSLLGKVYIDPTRCFGCGVCRPACATSAIQLIPREEDSQAAGVWLKSA